MQPSRVHIITTTIIPPMTAPTITGVDESEEEMLTWMGDVMLVAFSIGVSGVAPLVAVTVMVYCTPGFRPACKVLKLHGIATDMYWAREGWNGCKIVPSNFSLPL